MTDGDLPSEPAPEATDAEAAEVEGFVQAVFVRYGHDLRGYSRASLTRRLAVAVSRSPQDSLSRFQHDVLRSREAFTGLLDTLAVPATEMFRHPATWRLLRERVIPRLSSYPRPNIWVAGSSTGEEVYSIAIVLAEAGLLDRCVIHATDLSPAAVRSAREGIVPAESIKRYTENYQASGGVESFSQYFTAAYGLASLDPALRANVSFHQHSLAVDGPFGQMHLILCRNVLIYFDRALQDRAVGLFVQSLARRGFLCLGSRESLRFNAHGDAFDALDPTAQLYQLK